MLINVLTDFVEKAIPEDLQLIQKAYALKDWEQVEKMAHKMKGGTVYCATFKMKYACQYLERYRKAGHHGSLDKLYHQLIAITEETQIVIDKWLHIK